jgi:protein phosphatase-4 regulatory subunit 3
VPQFELFNEYFYQHHAHRLLVPFCDIEKIIHSRNLTDVECDHYFHMCELVSSFVLLHAYKIKYLLVRDQMLHGVCFLMRCHQSFVKLASLRVFRTLISVKDTFYHRTMLSSHIFEQVFEAYRVCRGRNNLLRAAILDFFTAIHADRCQVLIDYLVPKYRELLEGFSADHEVFTRIVALYDSGYKVGEESQISTDGVGQDKSKGMADTSVSTGNWGDIDFSEEDYFSGAESANDQEMQEAPIVGEASKRQIEDALPPIPPIRAKAAAEDEEFGGILGGDVPSKPAPSPGNTAKTGPMKLGLKIGTTLSNLWRSAAAAGSSSAAATNGAGSESPASPNKKSKF